MYLLIRVSQVYAIVIVMAGDSLDLYKTLSPNIPQGIITGEAI